MVLGGDPVRFASHPDLLPMNEPQARSHFHTLRYTDYNRIAVQQCSAISSDLNSLQDGAVVVKERGGCVEQIKTNLPHSLSFSTRADTSDTPLVLDLTALHPVDI